MSEDNLEYYERRAREEMTAAGYLNARKPQRLPTAYWLSNMKRRRASCSLVSSSAPN